MPLLGPLAALFGAPDPAPGRGQRPVGPDVFDDAVGNPHPWVAAIARILRGHWTLNLGQRHAQAEADFLAGASILAELGERWGQAVAFGGLAMVEGWRGEHAAAVGHYRQASELTAAFGSTEDQVQFRLFMVRQLWLAGEREAARDELSRALPDAERLGLPALRAFALVRAVQMATTPDVAQQLGAVAATGLGYLAGAQGNLDEARDWHAQALAAARSSGDAPVIAEALTGLADLALRENDAERSAELLGASVAIRGTTDRSAQDEKRVADLARSVLGEARYAQAYQRGRRVTVDTLAALTEVTPGA
jgi:tetratricopeptide (TPR) repeat protein